jgi:hypothetical protein
MIIEIIFESEMLVNSCQYPPSSSWIFGLEPSEQSTEYNPHSGGCALLLKGKVEILPILPLQKK